jgi:hypothetical protein
LGWILEWNIENLGEWGDAEATVEAALTIAGSAPGIGDEVGIFGDQKGEWAVATSCIAYDFPAKNIMACGRKQ